MNLELSNILQERIHKDIQKIILSNPRKKDQEFQKVVIENKQSYFLLSKYTIKQVFHEKVSQKDLFYVCQELIEDGFKQANLFEEQMEYGIKISKQGKCLLSKNKTKQEVKVETEHNRKKNYVITEGEIIPPLIDMGIFTKEGKIINTMYDKFKQINKFIEIIDDAVSKYEFDELNIIDFGCGKSYLTFIVYYFLHEKKGINVKITGLDLKEDVIEHCNLAAQKYGYENLTFKVGNIDGYKSDTPVDMVISLHACDTATDFALFNAISWDAKIILSVPCCQHELGAQLKSDEISIIQRYGIIKERAAALYTDAIRANLLTSCGYKTQLLEFVDLSHTPKNILIRATKANIAQSHKKKMLEEVTQLCDCFHLEPTLLRLLQDNEKESSIE